MRKRIEISTEVYTAGIAILTAGKANISVLMDTDIKLKNYEHLMYLLGELEKLNVVGPQYSYSHPRRILMSQEEFIKQYEPEKTDLNIYRNKLKKDFDAIDSMDGIQFEQFCCSILIQNGFYNVDVTKASGDHGVDVLAEKDDIRYAIQCKCFSTDLGNTPIQEVYAGKEMYDCHVGVVMTNRFFTLGAKELAKKTRTLLWDRDRLAYFINNATQV